MIDTNKIMLAASAMVLSISAQAFTVKGVVIDHSTKEPLIGATVQVEWTTTGVITDIDGRFEIRDIKGKSCTLVVQYVSYKTQKLIVQKGQKEELVIALSPDNQRKHTIFRLDAHYSQPYLCAVTFNNNDYGKRKSKLSGGI